MTRKPTQRAHLRRLGIPLLVAWSVAWLLGIAILANVAINQRAERRDADLDTQLALYATAVYGLTWFDDGGFHDELLRLETDWQPAPYDLWVIAPANPPVQHLAPPQPRFAIADFSFLIPEVMGQARKVYRDGVDTKGQAYRLYAIPTYTDQANDAAPKAMVIVVADPVPGQVAYQAFVRRIWLTALALGVIGLLVGTALTYWSLRPAFAALQQRERFLSATAHELRTPVAALRSICESAQRGDEAPHLALTRMETLLRSASHTLEDLLLFARLDAGATLERQPVRLDLLVETLLPDDDSVRFVATASVVNLDPRLASVAVRNLIENARKYGQRDGVAHITVTVSGAQVVVEDQGKGFSEALLTRRETDFVISPTQGGTGLGLAIVNMVARLHGGALRLENRAEGGARVTVNFMQ
jgi:signal transduction histidine kinase